MRFPSHGHIPPHVTLLSTPSLSLFLPSGLSVREQRLGAPPCHPPTKPTCVSETCWVPGMPGNTLKVGQPQQEQQLLFPGLGPVCDRAGKTVVASEAPTVAVCPHPSTSDYSPGSQSHHTRGNDTQKGCRETLRPRYLGSSSSLCLEPPQEHLRLNETINFLVAFTSLLGFLELDRETSNEYTRILT